MKKSKRSKEFNEKSNRTLHRVTPFLTAVVTLLTLLALCVGMAPCSLAADDFSAENRRLCEAALTTLGAEIERYSAFDTSSNKELSQSASVAINLYRREIIEIQSDPLISSRSFESEIKLAEAKAIVAGNSTWVYRSRLLEYPALSTRTALSQCFEKISAEIATATQPATLSANTTRYITSINQAAFSELVRLERISDDSLAVNAIIEGAIDEIEKTESTDASGEVYRKIYEKAAGDIALRRTKDKLTAELEAVYKIILPTDDFSSDRHVALFVYQLDSKTKLEEMNIVLKNTILSLLDTLRSEKYTSALIDSLSSAVVMRVEAANQVGSIPSARNEFSNFAFEYARASAKDTVAIDIASRKDPSSPELTAIEAEYNRANGIFDLCTGTEQLKFEVKRAALRADWYEEYCDACSEIETILAPHDTSSILESLKAEYSKYSSSIALIAFSDRNAEVLTNAEFAKGVTALEEAKDIARIEKFKGDHADIIKKEEADINANDAKVLSSAIEDAIALGDKLTDRISDISRGLISKYKIAFKAMLSEKSFDEPAKKIWADAITTISNEADAISSALPVPDAYATISRLSDRASSIEILINEYTEILVSEEYKTFTDDGKATLSSACRESTEIILDVNITPISWEQRLEEAMGKCRLIMLKAYSASSLRAMASMAKDETASPIADNAAVGISNALTQSEVTAIYNAARFKLTQILQYESILAEAEELQKRISSLKYLSDERKAEFCNKISEGAAPLANKIKAAISEEALRSAYETASTFLYETEGNAKSENLKIAKRLADSQLSAEISKKESNVTALVHISAEVKKELLNKLTTQKNEFSNEINTVETIEALEELKENIEKAIAEFAGEIAFAEVNACRTMIKESYLEITKQKEKYSDENYKSLTSVADASILFIDSCTNLEEMLKEQKTVLDELRKIPTMLDTAKASAKSELDNLYEAITKVKMLYSSEKFEVVGKLYESAVQKIEAITEFKDLEKVTKLLRESVVNMTSIAMDKLQTADSVILSSTGAPKYPAGYLISANGYPAYITAEGKIPYGSSMKLSAISIDGQQKILRKIIKSGSAKMSSGEALSKELAKALKKAEFILGFELDTTLEFDGTAYRLTILLPDGFDTEKIVSVVSICENSSAEIYNFAIDGSLLTISLDSPGEFFIAIEKNDLTLILIIILAILLFVLIAFLAFRYFKKDGEDTSIPPDTSPTDPTTAIQAIDDSRDLQSREKAGPPQSEAPKKEEKHKEEQPQKDIGEKASNSENEKVAIDEDILFGEFCSGSLENNSEPKNKKSGDTVPPKLYRAEINLETLAKNFKAGEVITLKDMIKKGLVPPETTFVKVLAKGKISKPLTVIAQDFSTSAMRMILLAGGNATIAEELIDTDKS